MNNSYVYILASKKHGTLYTGVTNDLVKRVWEHKNHALDGFTKKYKVTTLVYYEPWERYEDAAYRETQMKRWKREWKIELIEKIIPSGTIYMIPLSAKHYGFLLSQEWRK